MSVHNKVSMNSLKNKQTPALNNLKDHQSPHLLLPLQSHQCLETASKGHFYALYMEGREKKRNTNNQDGFTTLFISMGLELFT